MPKENQIKKDSNKNLHNAKKGKTDANNCQMLCKLHNRMKSGK